MLQNSCLCNPYSTFYFLSFAINFEIIDLGRKGMRKPRKFQEKYGISIASVSRHSKSKKQIRTFNRRSTIRSSDLTDFLREFFCINLFGLGGGGAETTV